MPYRLPDQLPHFGDPDPGYVRYWMMAHCRIIAPLAVFPGHEGSIHALALLLDGRFLSAGADNTMRLGI